MLVLAAVIMSPIALLGLIEMYHDLFDPPRKPYDTSALAKRVLSPDIFPPENP